MAIDFHIKQNDTNPALESQLQDQDGNAIDLSTGSTHVDFHMRPEGEEQYVVRSSATITDAPNGKVEYDWEKGDTSETGVFEAEFQITYDNGDIETVPNDGYIRIGIDAEVA